MRNDLEFQAVVGNLETKNLKPKIREGLESLCRELMAANDHFQKQLYSIKTDPRYSEKGRDLLTQQLGDSILEKVQPYASAYDEHINGVKRNLFAPRNKQQTEMAVLVNIMRNQELRSQYRMHEMDPLELEAHLDDPQFLEAVVTSPKPLLPPDRLDDLLIKKAEKSNPEAAALLEDYSFAQGAVKALVNTIKADIKASGWKETSKEEIEAKADALEALAA